MPISAYGIGRLTRDPEVRETNAGKKVVNFSIASNRKFDANTADFINCSAFGGSAEFIEKYFHKGDPIMVRGEIQTDSYTNKDGKKVSNTVIVLENAEFCPINGKKEEAVAEKKAPARAKQQTLDDGFKAIEGDDDLPF